MMRSKIKSITVIVYLAVSTGVLSSEYSNEQLIRELFKAADTDNEDLGLVASALLEKQAPDCADMLMATFMSKLKLSGELKPASKTLAKITADVCQTRNSGMVC